MEMESPRDRRQQRQTTNASSIYTSIAEQPPVYLEGLDVFDEYEQRFNDFLRSTPYIDQILQTSKEYRLVIESLNILAVSILVLTSYSASTMSSSGYAPWRGSTSRKVGSCSCPSPSARTSTGRTGN